MRLLALLVLASVAAPLAAGSVSKVPPPPAERAAVRVGAAPCGIAARAGAVWVAVYESGTLVSLDRRGRVTRRVRVGASACRLAVSRNAVWVARDRASQLVRLDLRTGTLSRITVPAEPFDVLLAAGSLWVASHATGVVSRLDPATGGVLARVDVGTEPSGIAWCGGRVWVGHGDEADWVTAIDPKTLATRRIDGLLQEPRAPTCIHGVVWVVAPGGVARIDPARGRVLTLLPLEETLSDAAAARDGTVWVTDKEHSRIHRLTPDGRRRLDSFPAGRGAFALARTGGSMWVTSYAGTDVRRYDVR